MQRSAWHQPVEKADHKGQAAAPRQLGPRYAQPAQGGKQPQLQDKFQRCATGAEQNQNRAPKQPNRAIEELAGRVAEKLNKPRGSGYVERCRDYIQKRYREKIYLEDIAETLGLSPTYLSRLFKKETGICIQDAINEERVFRAANLLLYSELSLTEIAQYVGFPNQSYMGKIFKKLRNMTPMTYRDRFKNQEAGI